MKKRLLSVLLSIAVLSGSVDVTAWAGESRESEIRTEETASGEIDGQEQDGPEEKAKEPGSVSEPNAEEDASEPEPGTVPEKEKAQGEEGQDSADAADAPQETKVSVDTTAVSDVQTSDTWKYKIVTEGDSSFAEITGLANKDEKPAELSIPGKIDNQPVKAIGNDAFYNCTSLTKVTFADNTIETIGDGAFGQCSNLAEIKLPSGLKSIGGGAFGNCTALTTMTIPASVTKASSGNAVFEGCTGLTEILFEEGEADSPRIIPAHICRKAAALKTVIIPKNTKSIGNESFFGCTSLTTVTFADDTVEIIGDSAFSLCSSLKSIAYPYGLKQINNNAFKDCAALEEAEFFSRLKLLGSRAFENCTSLKNVWFNSLDTKIAGNAFTNTAADLKIYGYKYATAVEYAQNQNLSCEVVDALSMGNDGLAVPNTKEGLKQHRVLYNKTINRVLARLDDQLRIIADDKGVPCTSIVFWHNFMPVEIDRVGRKEDGSIVGYSGDIGIPLNSLFDRYSIEYDNVDIKKAFGPFYKKLSAYIGSCYGMSYASLLAHYAGGSAEKTDQYFSTDIYKKYPQQVTAEDINTYSYDQQLNNILKLNEGSSLLSTIDALQEYQFEDACRNFHAGAEADSTFLMELKNYVGIKNVFSRQKSLAVGIYWDGGAHSVLVDTSRNVEYASADDRECNEIQDDKVWYKIKLIDPNYPGWNYSADQNPAGYDADSLDQTIYNQERALLVSEDGDWRYCVSKQSDEEKIVAGSGVRNGRIEVNEVDQTTFTTGSLGDIYDHIENMRTGETAQKTKPEGRRTVRAITKNMTVRDSGGKVVFEMKDAVVLADVHHGCFKPAGYLLDGTDIDKFELTLPAEGCTIEMTNGTWLMHDSLKLCGISSDAPTVVTVSALNDITVVSSANSEVSYYMGSRTDSAEESVHIDWETCQEAANKAHLALTDGGQLLVEADSAVTGSLDVWRKDDASDLLPVRNVSSDDINGKEIVEYVKQQLKEEEETPDPVYQIVYMDGETRLALTPDRFTEKDTTLLPAPAKSGYDFAGWYETPDFSGGVVSWIPEGTTADRVFYAKWAEHVRQNDIQRTETSLSVEFAGTGVYPYTGAAVKPEVIVRDESRILQQGRDYTVSYKNNIQAATTVPGMAEKGIAPYVDGRKAPMVLITGKGNYKGRKAAAMNFTIRAKEITDASVAFACSDSMAVKAGRNGGYADQQPAVTLTDGRKLLNKTKDYIITYDYLGEDGSQVPSGTDLGMASVGRPGVYAVHVAARIVNDDSGRMIRSLAKGNASNANYTGRLDPFLLYVQDSAKILSKAKITLVSARGIPQGTTGITADQVIKSIRFGSGRNAETYETDTAEKRAVFAEKFDVAGLDTLAERAGTGCVIVTAKAGSGYYGSRRVDVKIPGTPLKKAVFTLPGGSTAFTYNGEVQTPAYTLKKSAGGAASLTEGKDYTVTYQKGKATVFEPCEAGSYTAVYTGMGAYTGTVKKTFKILPLDLAAAYRSNKNCIAVTAAPVPYHPAGAVPAEVSVTYTPAGAAARPLTENDCRLVYSDNKKVGKGSMTLQGRGNYKGTVKNIASYDIVTKSLASEDLAVETADVFYKAGANITPRLTVYDNGVKVAAKNYRIAFADGAAALAGYRLPEGAEYADVPFTITADAGGNYTEGTQMTGTLHIYTRKISRAKVVLAKNGSDDSYYYTGRQVRPQIQSVTLRESANAQEITLVNRETDGYLVSYGENVKAGSAGVTVRGTGKYGGSKTVKFIIYPKWMKWFFG